MSEGEELKGGVEYVALISLKPDFGYVFSNDSKATVNNNAATIEAPVQEESEQGEGIIVVSAPVTAVHDWDEGTITKEPTTTEEGVKTFKCKACEETKTEAVPKKDDVTPGGGGSDDVTPVNPTPVNPQPAPVVNPTTPVTVAEIVDLPAVKISKPKAAKKKITVKWKKVSKKNRKKISGIQIQVATDPGFTNIVKTVTAGKKKSSKVIKGLQPKTKYYVSIRAYAAGDHVSVWKSRSAKVK